MNIQSLGSPSLAATGTPVAASAPRAEAASASRDVQATDAPAVAALNPGQAVAPTQPASQSQVEDAVKSIRDFVKPINSNVEFSIDRDTGKTVVKIVDGATKEVLRQMPSEEALAIAKTLDGIKGLLIAQKA